MLNPDDEKFEGYLKSFRPIAPEPMQKARPAERSPGNSRTLIWAAVVTAICLVTMVVLDSPISPINNYSSRQRSLSNRSPLEPLTIGTADSRLAAASSFNAALDKLAVNAGHTPIPAHKQSAIAVLKKENSKP